MTTKRGYVEHVSIKVQDIHWHIRFFQDVFGLGLREVDGDPAHPRQVWVHGGLQLMADPHFEGADGRLAHIGIMSDDAETVIAAARSFGVTHLPLGRNWLVLPDGLCVEVIQASGDAVSRALAIDPRA